MIVSIGEPMVEFNQVEERRYLQGFGGDTSNMVIAAARSGARTAYITRVGDDEFGRMLLDLWTREGVDTRWVIVDREAPTGAYFVTHGPRGHVFSYLRKGSAASRLAPSDLPERRHLSCMRPASPWRSRNLRPTQSLRRLKKAKARSPSIRTCASGSGR